MTRYLDKPHLIILGAIGLIFLVSANSAWLNPDPNYVIKTHERIPILWQYNGDSVVEFLSAAYFPEYYRIDKTRINRPGYPALAHYLGKIWAGLAYPIHQLSPLAQGLLGYLTLKFIVYISGAFALFSIITRWFSKEVALGGVLLTFLHPFSVLFSTTFHTSELQFITPIFLIYLWLKLCDDYSHRKNIAFSLITGVLMLAKQNYAVYLAILLFSFFRLKKFKETFLSGLIHLIPLVLWLIALKILKIPYYNHESANGLVVWLYKDLIFKNPIEIIKIIIGSFNLWLVALISYFSFLILITTASVSSSEVRNKLPKNVWLFAGIFIVLSWFQTFAANRYNHYMTSDLAIFIFPLAAALIMGWVMKHNLKKHLPIFLTLYFLLGLLTLMKFPWVHPYDQKNIISENPSIELQS